MAAGINVAPTAVLELAERGVAALQGTVA